MANLCKGGELGDKVWTGEEPVRVVLRGSSVIWPPVSHVSSKCIWIFGLLGVEEPVTFSRDEEHEALPFGQGGSPDAQRHCPGAVVRTHLPMRERQET